eukprot:s5_g14.t1
MEMCQSAIPWSPLPGSLRRGLGGSTRHSSSHKPRLQLHKAILEPLSDHLRDSAGRPQDARFPGRAYFLGDEPPPAAVAANRAREAKMSVSDSYSFG